MRWIVCRKDTTSLQLGLLFRARARAVMFLPPVMGSSPDSSDKIFSSDSLLESVWSCFQASAASGRLC